jgi:hypothetical protein
VLLRLVRGGVGRPALSGMVTATLMPAIEFIVDLHEPFDGVGQHTNTFM